MQLVAIVAAAALPASPAARPLTETDLASPAANAIKKVPKEVINAPKPKRFSLEAKQDEDLAAARYTEEIRVFGDRDPEDVVAQKRPPLLAFRDKLARERTLTPKDITMMGLCLIGLCGANYGQDGAPVEDKTIPRGERGAQKSSIEMIRQFSGTYQ